MKTRLSGWALAAASLLLALPPLLAQEPNPIPSTFRNIYPQASEAKEQVQKAIHLAAQQKKRVLLDFGTDQCADCQVLEKYLHETANHAQIAEHFLLVRIDVGAKHDQNLDLARRYGVPVSKGVPALSVVDGQGKVVHAQANGEFKNARNLSPDDVLTFLNKWRT